MEITKKAKTVTGLCIGAGLTTLGLCSYYFGPPFNNSLASISSFLAALFTGGAAFIALLAYRKWQSKADYEMFHAYYDDYSNELYKMQTVCSELYMFLIRTKREDYPDSKRSSDWEAKYFEHYNNERVAYRLCEVAHNKLKSVLPSDIENTEIDPQELTGKCSDLLIELSRITSVKSMGEKQQARETEINREFMYEWHEIHQKVEEERLKLKKLF